MKNVYSRSFKIAPPPRNSIIATISKNTLYFISEVCNNSDIKHHKRAFTLAEVLIILGIIGIVAAMTMPNLVTNFQKKRAVTQLKATYSILSQAFERAKSDYGDMTNWDTGSYYGQSSNEDELFKSFTEKYFIPYVKPIKNYGITTFKKIGYDGLYYLNKTTDDSTLKGKKYIIALANGAIIGFSLDGHCDEPSTDSEGNWVCDSGWYFTHIYIVADINGIQNPNTLGKDIFVMKVESNKFGFYSYSNTQNDREWLLKACSKDSTENRHCGRLIQYDSWEINYPW